MSKFTLTKCKNSITVRVSYVWNKFLTSKEKGMDLPTKFKSAIKSKLAEVENKICYFYDFVLVFLYSSSGGFEFSSYKIKLRNRVTQNHVILRVTNSKIFIEIVTNSSS